MGVLYFQSMKLTQEECKVVAIDLLAEGEIDIDEVDFGPNPNTFLIKIMMKVATCKYIS